MFVKLGEPTLEAVNWGSTLLPQIEPGLDGTQVIAQGASGLRSLLQGGFMRTTLNLEDELLRRAAELTGIKEKTSLVRLGLKALIARESAKRLAALGGTEEKLALINRRRLAET